MKSLLTPANIVWVILVLATGLSYGIAEGHSGQSLGALLVGLLFTLAAVKGWFSWGYAWRLSFGAASCWPG